MVLKSKKQKKYTQNPRNKHFLKEIQNEALTKRFD